MENKFSITKTIMFIVIIVLWFISLSQWLWKNHRPSNYNEMTAGQLLDVKIDYDKQIQALKDDRQEVIDIYNVKRWRVNTGTTVTWNDNTAIEQVNKELGLQ